MASIIRRVGIYSAGQEPKTTRFLCAYDAAQTDKPYVIRMAAFDRDGRPVPHTTFKIELLMLSAEGGDPIVVTTDFVETRDEETLAFHEIPADYVIQLYMYQLIVSAMDGEEAAASATVEFGAVGKAPPEGAALPETEADGADSTRVSTETDPTFLAGEVIRAIGSTSAALQTMNGFLETMTTRLGETVLSSTGALEASQRAGQATMAELEIVQTANLEYRTHLTQLGGSVKTTLTELKTAFESGVADKVAGVPQALTFMREQVELLLKKVQPIIDRVPANEEALGQIKTTTGTMAETVSHFPDWMKNIGSELLAINELLKPFTPERIGNTFKPFLDGMDAISKKQGKLPETVADLVAQKNAKDLQEFTEVLSALSTALGQHPTKVAEEVAARIKSTLETLNQQMRLSYGSVDEKFVATKTAVENLAKLLDPTKMGAEMAAVVREAITTIQAESATQVEAIRRVYDEALTASDEQSAEQIETARRGYEDALAESKQAHAAQIAEFRRAHSEALAELIRAIGTAQEADAESRKQHLADAKTAFEAALGQAGTTKTEKPEDKEPKKEEKKLRKHGNLTKNLFGFAVFGGAFVTVVWVLIKIAHNVFSH